VRTDIRRGEGFGKVRWPPLKILLANPNATEAITETCSALARAVASPGTEVIGWTNREGPPMVDSFYADYAAGRLLSRSLARWAPPPDAVVLAGFGNYGTAAVKEVMDVPVLNLAEAALAFAIPFCHRFAVLTTSPRMVPYTQDLIALLGLTGRCAGVRAVSLPPLDAAEPSPPEAESEVLAAVDHVVAESAADLVILGGSRLSPYAAHIRDRAPVPVVEPVACAVQMAEAAVRLGLRQSKTCKFAPPTGMHDRWA
jgi:allantoin racemase